MHVVPQVGPVIVTVRTHFALETFLLLALDGHVPPQVFNQRVRFAAAGTLESHRN